MKTQSSAPARATRIDQRESVRLLAIQLGSFREAARQLGINENTVLQWSKRYQWTVKPEHKSNNQSDVITVIKQPSTVLLDELAENERETKLSLARYAKRVSKDVEEHGTINHAPLVHKTAQIAGLVHKWGDDKPGQQFTLNVLNINSLSVDQEQS